MTKSTIVVVAALLASASPPTAARVEASARERSTQVASTNGDSSEPDDHERTSPREMEVGAGLGTVSSWWSGPFNGVDLRVGFPIADRGAIETLVGYSPHGSGREAPIGLYGAQFRHDLHRHPGGGFNPFLTYGAIGVFGRERGYEYQTRNADGTTFTTRADSTGYFTPPFAGLVGFGVQRRLHHRVAVRVDVQAIVVLVIPVGVRAAAGVTVPVGATRRSRPAAVSP